MDEALLYEQPAGPVIFLSSSILTSDGQYLLRTISPSQAQKAVSVRRFESAIGHEATAVTVSMLLNIDCPMNRKIFKQEVGQSATIFQPTKRLPEGLTPCESLQAGNTNQLLHLLST
ncbi:DUF1874 domain-containing protein [Hydrogenophaga sp. NH-16]|uniref:STIV orfB116 family protein n=1 Tax=Hydrogenophaga sp. NH-16 TaxID=2184519 RepID=UPI0013E3D0AE|nr:DUF1874 domain-containing protein [Hydrogenophaga sp. NH-16]